MIWSVGEMGTILWDPSSLVISELMNTSDVKVDISLWTYNYETETFEEAMMLVTNLPNSGSASLSLPV